MNICWFSNVIPHWNVIFHYFLTFYGLNGNQQTDQQQIGSLFAVLKPKILKKQNIYCVGVGLCSWFLAHMRRTVHEWTLHGMKHYSHAVACRVCDVKKALGLPLWSWIDADEDEEVEVLERGGDGDGVRNSTVRERSGEVGGMVRRVCWDLWGRVRRGPTGEGSGGWYWAESPPPPPLSPPTPFRYYNTSILWSWELGAANVFCPQCQTVNGGCCMRALSLRSARCHGLNQGTPFMHSVRFGLIRLWAPCVFSFPFVSSCAHVGLFLLSVRIDCFARRVFTL